MKANIIVFFADNAKAACERFGTADFENPMEMDVLVLSLEDATELWDALEDASNEELESLACKRAKQFKLEGEVVRQYWATEVKEKQDA